MRQQQLSQSEEEQNDEYQNQQRDIVTLIEKYKESKKFLKTERKPNVYKQIDNAFFHYEQLLQTNYASPAKWTWLSDRKAQINILKNQKATQNQQTNARNFVTKAHIEVLAQQNNQALQNIQKNIEQAIQISTFIKVELQKQIQDLDRVYETNKDINVRIKRSMDGLRIMLRRIMMSKFTKFLSIITVLAVIALIVVYVLKNNGTI